jgi:hypothetical protein
MMYHGGEADVASQLQAGQPRCRGLTSIRGQEIFYFSKASPIWLWGLPSLLLNGYNGGLFAWE